MLKGSPTWTPPNKYPDEVRAQVVAAVKEGTRTRKDIAKEHGVHPSTVRDWCGPTAEWKKAQETRKRFQKDAIELYWEGYTYAYIGKQLGIPVSTVWEYVNREYGPFS